jgi:hypothetical protein
MLQIHKNLSLLIKIELKIIILNSLEKIKFIIHLKPGRINWYFKGCFSKMEGINMIRRDFLIRIRQKKLIIKSSNKSILILILWNKKILMIHI